MCGIAGIIDFRGRRVDQHVLERFCTLLAHRGPDDSGIWQAQLPGFSAALAHTRLAVIDPTPEAHQPMTDETGRRALAYNGELYNYRELRAMLAPPPRTSSDTEVVLRACMTWGPSALTRFDAMWAMAFVDAEARAGHLSRDPFGIKPLFYAHHDGRLVFASELAAIRRVGIVPLEIDRDALGIYLTLGWIPHPYTIYKHVRRLPPGHRLDFDASGPREPERYYRLPAPPSTAIPYDEACREVRRRVEASVNRQRVADVPLGAFLSGGLDSSIIVACMARAGGPPVQTFTIGYPAHPRYDESAHAEAVARHFGTEHHAVRVEFSDVLETIEPMLDHLGEPFADSSLLPAALVSKHTRRHVTVALSGDGGDELFGGYWRYLGHQYLERYRRIPALMRKAVVEPLLRLIPTARTTRRLDRLRQMRKLLRGDLADPMDRHLAWARMMDNATAASLLGEEPARSATRHLDERYRNAAADWHGQSPDAPSPMASHFSLLTSHFLSDILLADLAIGLPCDMLHKIDTASMFHSLEVRVPLLAPDVVEFVTGLPIDHRIQGSTGKRILKDAFRDVLPPQIPDRRKMGFEVPIGEFLRHELRERYHGTVTAERLSELGLDAHVASSIYDDHLHRRQDYSELLWALLVLCHWKSQGSA